MIYGEFFITLENYYFISITQTKYCHQINQNKQVAPELKMLTVYLKSEYGKKKIKTNSSGVKYKKNL